MFAAPCGDPGSPPAGILRQVAGTSFAHGTRVTYSCMNPQYQFIGSNVIVCEAGRWSGNVPVASQCRLRQQPTNSMYDYVMEF